jgi:PAS domain S-box-containing protein
MAKETCRSQSGIEQLEIVFDNMFDAVFILDVSKGEIVYANRAMCAMYGYSPSEALQLTIPELSSGEPHGSLEVAMDSLSMAARGSAQLINWKARKKDGTLFWTETSLQNADVAGKDLVIALVRDITERKKMEEELLLSHFCIEKAAIGIFQISLNEGKILRANDSASRSLGYSPDELFSMSVLDIDPSLTWEKFIEIKSMLETSGSVTFETTHRRKDGTVFPAEITASNLGFQGMSTGFVFFRDISEQKRAVTDLQLTQFFVDKASIGILRISEDGNILFANAASCRSLGYTAEELCSMTVFDINPTFNPDKFREHRRSARAAGSRTFETIHRRKDGSAFPVEIIVNYLEYQDKEISVSFVKDITERKRAEEALKESELRLKMAMDLARLVQWEYDVKSGMFTFDDQFYALYGTTADREGGTLMSAEEYASKFIPPEEYAVVTEGIVQALAASSNQLEHRIIRADGEERLIVVRGEAVRDQSGCITKLRGANQDITERKRAEELLRKSEMSQRKLARELAQKNNFLRTLIDAIPDLIFYKDCNRAYLGCNRAFEVFAGRTEKDLVGRTDLDIFSRDVAVSFRETDLEILSTEGSQRYEEWIDYPDGRRVLLETLKTPLFDLEGEILGVVGVSRDITERKRVEEALLFSQFCIDKAGIGIYQSDGTGSIFNVNDHACKSLGYTREELCALSVFDIDQDITREKMLKLKEILDEKGSVTHETTHRRRDGTTFPVEITANNLDFRGKTYGISFVKDITERKRAEEALRAANLVVENSPAVLFRWRGDDEWPVELVSGNIIQFGYTPDEFLSGSITYSSIVHPDDLERLTREVHDSCNKGADQLRLEYRIMTKGGDVRWVNEHTNVERDAAGGVKNFEGIVIDVTERKLAEEELKRQKKLLQELNETLEKRVGEEVAKNREKDIMLIQQNRQAALGEMLDHIAHQWKQPLNSISLIIQDLGETASYGELTDAHLEETVSKTMSLLDHMAQTIDIFRGFYRPDKEKKAFSIKDAIDQALAFIAPAFRFHSIAVELDVDPGLTAFGYPKEYAQVLLNILANARDALRARQTEKPRVIIRAFAEGSKTVVSISDNAGGIPEAIIGKIFDFYFTTNESSGGTGIGLYMSKNIIEKNMGGTLSAINTEGGAQFRIEVKLS